MNHARTRRWAAGAVVTTLLAGLLSLVTMTPAAANHGDLTLEVYREFTSTKGTSITLTARVQNDDGSPAVGLEKDELEIDWEIEGLAVDGEGGAKTYASPDRSCRDTTTPSLAAPYYECSITITSGGALGTGFVRAWIDHDQNGGVAEADQLEGRLSSVDSDCETELPEPLGTHPEQDNTDAYDTCREGTEQPGDAGKAEPDDTDVVQITFAPADAVPHKLDCPEETLAPAGAGEVGTVACRVTDSGGRPLAGWHVDGELYANADDKEAPADFNGDNDSDTECVTGGDGVCRVRVPAENANTGNFEVCFWVDDDHDDDDDALVLGDPSFGSDAGDGGQCATEPAAGAADGAANITDRVFVVRELRALTTLDLEPESSTDTTGTLHTLTARALDQFGDQWTGATSVKLEWLAGSAQDSDGSSPGLPDRSCTTPGTGDNPGTCTFSYSSSSPGTDTICGWIGATPSATCNDEPQNKNVDDAVDVVVQKWVAAASTTSTTAQTAEDVAKTQGYTLVGADGGIFNYGTSTFHGSTGGMKLNEPVIGIASKKGGTGYWLVARDGGIFTFGDAEFFGSMGDKKLNAPILGMEATPSGNGYWLFAADGGIFTFGDAVFKGSTGDMSLNAPVVGMAVTEKGDGYWLVARDGGIFTFDAPFHGSTGSMKLNEPVFDMGATPGDKGYWLVARDGGIFSFGDAETKFYGSAVGATSNQVIGLGVTPTGAGYWIADNRGAVFPFGDARFLGDRRQETNNATIVGFNTVPKK